MSGTSTSLRIPPEIKENWVTIALLLIFLLAFSIRMVPTRFGTILDPDAFFMYRMARDVVESGYYPTHDNLGWQPGGRHLKSEMPLLPLSIAYSYMAIKAVGARMSLMTWTVAFPAIIGSLSIFPVYLIGKKMRDRTTGLLGAVLLATIPDFLHRSMGGITDKEVLAFPLILGGLALIFLLLEEENTRLVLLKTLSAGFLLGLVGLTWGGFTYILLLLPVFYGLIILLDLTGTLRLRDSAIVGLILASTIMAMVSMGIRNWGLTNPFVVLHIAATLGLGLYLLLVRVLVGMDLVGRRTAVGTFLVITAVVGLLPIYGPAVGVEFYVASKFMILLNPFETPDAALHVTVQEYEKPSTADWFARFSFYPFLAIAGAGLALKRRRVEDVLLLLWAASGFYAGLSAIRNTMILAPVLCILAGDAIREFMDVLSREDSLTGLLRSRARRGSSEVANELRMARLGAPLAAVALVLIIVPSTYFGLQMVQARTPRVGQGWLDALTWLNQETPEDAVIMSWWDYGHWITAVARRRCVTDGATTNSTTIESTARAYLSSEEEALEILEEYDVGYVVVPERDFWIIGAFAQIVGNITDYPEGYYEADPESGSISWDDLTPKAQNTTIFRLLFAAPDPEARNFELVHQSPSSESQQDTNVRIYKVN